MIDVKIIRKAKSGSVGTSGTIRLGGATVSGESAHAATSDVAQRAILADKAKHAYGADAATYAENANTASKATHAESAKALDSDSPTRQDFVSSQHKDSAKEVITFEKGLVTPLVTTPGFAPGMSGAGAAMTTDEQGRTHITADFLTARQGLTVTVMAIEELKSTDGGVVISKANGEVERVSEYTNSSGAVVMQLFIRDAATTSAGLQRLRFRTGDFVRCSRTDLSAGTPQRSYWVQVDGVSPGDGSLHILKSRFGEYGTLPLPDDTLVLMGSATDPDRRGCIYIATDSSGEHITVLSGINTPSLEGCQRVRLGSLEGLMLAGELMHGYGLASDNCYLAGRFKLASSGRDVEDEIGSTVRDLASGGVNLLTGTRDFSGWELHESAERPGEYQGAVRLYGDASGATAYRDLAQAAFRFEADTEYTLSFYGWGSRIQTYCYPGLGSVIGANSGTAASGVTRNDTMCEFILGGTPERHYVTFRTASSGIPATGWVLFRIPATEDAGIAGVKLERGGLMTPWSLAPGDTAKIEDSVTTLRGEVEATNAGFLSEFSKTTEYIDGEIDRVESSIEQTAEKISLKVERTAQGGANLLAGSYTGEALGHWWQGGGTWETRPSDFNGYGLTVRSAGADIAVSLRDGSNNAIFTPEIPAGTDIVLGLDVSRVIPSLNAPKPVVTAALYQGGQTASGTIYGEAQIPGTLAPSTRIYIPLRTTVAAKLGLTLQIKNVPAGTLVTLSGIMMERGTVAHAFSPFSSDPADLIRRLKATGIDIMEGSVTVTADRVTFEDNAGNEQAIIQDGKLRADLIDTDTLTARRLVATAPDGAKRASLNESGDGMYRIYDPDGGYRIAEYGVAEVTVRSKSVLTIARGYGADGTLTWYQTPRGEILDPTHIPYTVETIRCAGPFASVADMQKPVTLGPVKELYVLRIDTQAYPEAAELDGRTATRNTYEAFADNSEYLAEAGEYGSPEFGSATLGNTTTYSRQRYMVDDGHMLAETGTTMWIRNNMQDV